MENGKMAKKMPGEEQLPKEELEMVEVSGPYAEEGPKR